MAVGDEFVEKSDPTEKEEEEEELVDPQDTQKETCSDSSACANAKARLDECTSKLSDGSGAAEETCEEELFDFLHCVDSCVSQNLFQHLK